MGALVCALSVPACSVLLEWNGFSDGASRGEGGQPGAEPSIEAQADVDSDSAVASRALTSCGTDKLCSPSVPAGAVGWSGPFALVSGPLGTLPSSCDPTVYAPAPAFSGNQALIAPHAGCSCTCGSPMGRTCSPPSLTFSTDPMCTNACSGPSGLPVDGGCVAVPQGCANVGVGASAPTGGACQADGGVTRPPIAWATGAIACSPTLATAGSCPPGDLCLPSTSPFCITHPGLASCPFPPYYVVQHVYYGDADDTRGCTECSCAAPSPGSCTLMAMGPSILDATAPPVVLYLDTTCGTPSGVLPFVPQSCTPSPMTKSLKLTAQTILDPGSCTPSIVMPTGDASPTTPTTFCCTN